MKDIYPWQIKHWPRLHKLAQGAAHALLFQGGKGIGKLDIAMQFAQSLLCQHPDQSAYACANCPACHWFEQASHPDFRLLQPEILSDSGAETESGRKPSKLISVEQIRGLADFFGMTAHQGGRRIIIIHPAEAMNNNAANALLKNLEEPPPGVLFILVSHQPQQLLPTILSRCMRVSLPSPDTASAVLWLKQRGLSNPEAALAASGFAPLQALQLDQQAGSEVREKLLRAVRQPANLDVYALAEALQKTEQVLVVQWLQQWCYDLNSMQLTGTLRYHLGDEANIKKLLVSVTPLNLARLLEYLKIAKREAQHTLNAKLFFESLLLVYRQLMLK